MTKSYSYFKMYWCTKILTKYLCTQKQLMLPFEWHKSFIRFYKQILKNLQSSPGTWLRFQNCGCRFSNTLQKQIFVWKSRVQNKLSSKFVGAAAPTLYPGPRSQKEQTLVGFLILWYHSFFLGRLFLDKLLTLAVLKPLKLS